MSEAVAHIEPEHGAFGGAYRPHPLAELFPLIEGPAYWDLVADIKANGVREPVVLLDGMVLDGRNRYLAAREAGRAVPTVDYVGSDPLAYVVSLNLKRRHLTDSQRAMVAGKIAKAPRGRPAENPPLGGITPPTTTAAAALLNVPHRAVERARAIHEDGAPALVASVEAGEVTVSAAAEVAKLPEAQQVEIVEEGPAAVREAARDIRAGIIKVATAPRARADRSNPHHQPNPLRDAALALVDHSAEIARLLGEHGATALLAALHDDASRTRALGAMTAARDALSANLEAEHARAA